MLNNIRNFSKTLLAKILLVIIIIPFVFWGMGGVFSSGNTNNIAKINNESISTQDFIDYLNSLNIEREYIKNNIENNIVEELLSQLISIKMLNLEVKKLNLIVSDEILSKKIKNNKNFIDENNKFSRIKYEKFLLSSNITAGQFESRLKESELKKKLFSYISGGIKSPTFLINKEYKKNTKKINIEIINLENIYKKKNEFTNDEITKFINENSENLKEKSINLRYSKITPNELIGISEYNQEYFDKIDEIENQISNGENFNNLLNKNKLKSTDISNLSIMEINNELDLEKELIKKILKNSDNDKVELLEENDYYLLYEISNIKKKLPDITDINFLNKVRELLFNKTKYEYNKNLIDKIGKDTFYITDFINLSKKNSVPIENIELDSIEDNEKLTSESVQFLYSIGKNKFTVISDKENNIYLAKIANISQKNITKNSADYEKYYKQSDALLKDYMYSSYDFFINDKYKIKINEKTLERVKNYFK